jgi:hypothetical protein
VKRHVHGRQPVASWLWSEVYRGLELWIAGRSFWLGWTSPDYKSRGW